MGGIGPLLVVLLVLGVLVVGGLVTVVSVLARAGEKARGAQVDELTSFGAARGLTYRRDDPALVTRFPGDPFGRGSARVARHVLEGRYAGRPVVLFEYRFVTRTGDHNRHHLVRVLATALPTAVPRLEVVPSSTFGTFVDGFSGGDHQLGDPVFDAAFRILTDSPEFAADVLDLPLRQWLFPQRPPYFRLTGADLVVAARGDLSAFEADRMLAFADGLLDRVPEQVWSRARRPLT